MNTSTKTVVDCSYIWCSDCSYI